MSPRNAMGLAVFALAVGAGCEGGTEELGMQEHAFDGRWSSQRAVRCDNGALADNSIGEIVFDGSSFDVTYVPFESYRDYWGSFDYDPMSGAIRFEVTDGNKLPPANQDLEGTARMDQDLLMLEELSLGSARPTFEFCGHILTQF